MNGVAQVLSDLHIPTEDGLDLCLVTIDRGKVRNYTSAAGLTLDQNLYMASALFGRGAITPHSGRTKENCGKLLWLPFDFDLISWLGATTTKQDLWTWPQEDIDRDIEGLRADIEESFSKIGLTLHRIDYTGYGIAGYVYLPDHGKDAVAGFQDAHKAIVTRINEVAGYELADPQVCDAGPRVTRVPGSLNMKNPAMPRTVRTLVQRSGHATEAQLRVAAGQGLAKPPTRLVPRTGKRLDDDTATLIVDNLAPLWSDGDRHRIALGMGGMLAKAGVPEEQAVSIVARMPDDEPWDREKAVATSYDRYRKGSQISGFQSLSKILPPSFMTWLDTELQPLRDATSPRIEIGSGAQVSDLPSHRREFEEAPEICFRGWVGDYCRIMSPTTEAPMAFHLGVGLTTAGALIGRKVANSYGPDPLYPNLFTLLVGRSGRTRKDSAIKRATRSIFDVNHEGSKIIDHPVNIATDLASSTKLIEILSKKPNTLLYVSEFSRLMGNAARGDRDTITPTLMEAFDTPTIMQNNSMSNPIEAAYPYLSIMAATQPDILSDTMSGTHMNSGFANRFLFICGNLGEAIPVAPRINHNDLSVMVRRFWDRRGQYTDRTMLEMTPEAVLRWRPWYIEDFYRESPSVEEDAMRARHAVLIQKIALIHAVGDKADAISVEHLDAGIATVEWMWRNLVRLIPGWGRSPEGRIEERVKELLLRNGAMKKRDVQQRCRQADAATFNKVVKSMVENGVVEVDDRLILRIAD